MKIAWNDGILGYDWTLRSRDVLWLGAGFSSCVTSGELPLMSNFFDRLEQFRAPSLFCFLKEWFGNPRRSNVEEALGALDQLETAPVAEARCKAKLGPGTGVRARRELGHYSIHRLSRCCLEPRHWAYGLLLAVDGSTTVVTTNYDTCAEYILGSRGGVKHSTKWADADCHNCRTNAILGYDCECGPRTLEPPATGEGAILKLHGSIAWRTCKNSECSLVECIVPVYNNYNTCCTCCNQPTEPVLVLPSMTKTYASFPHLQRMWDHALAAIEDAQRLIIFGFSFPTSDAAISRLFRSAVLQSKSIREIIVIDASPDPVAKRLREMLGSRSLPVIREVEVPIDGSTPKWWRPGPGELKIQQYHTEMKFQPPRGSNFGPPPVRASRMVVSWTPAEIGRQPVN